MENKLVKVEYPVDYSNKEQSFLENEKYTAKAIWNFESGKLIYITGKGSSDSLINSK